MKSDLLTSKKKCKTLKIIAIVLLVILTCITLFSVAAVAFDVNDYSSSSSSSSSSDDDDSDGLFAIIWLIFKLIPFPYNVILAGIMIVIFVIHGRKKIKGDKTVPVSTADNYTQFLSLPNRNAEIQAAVSVYDAAFVSDNMINFAISTWKSVQATWCAKDIESGRQYMSFNQFNTFKRQVQAKIDQGVTYHYEDISFPEAYLTSYARDKEFEYVCVYVHARYIDYQINDNSGEIIRGNKKTHWHIGYKMKFQRAVNRTAGSNTCPNCGAPLNLAASAVCEYCGTTITTANTDWVLSDFMTVRQDTVDEGIRQ